MNKRNMFKTILILLATIFIMHFQFQVENIGFFTLIPILFLLTNYMYKYKDKIKNNKFIYDVILMLLIFFSSLILLFISLNISNIIRVVNLSPIVIFIFGGLYLLLKTFIDCIITLNQENNKINDYMIIISFLIINLVFIRYYFDICNSIPGDIEKTYFIEQNYIYFFIMLFVIDFHKYINDKFLRMN